MVYSPVKETTHYGDNKMTIYEALKKMPTKMQYIPFMYQDQLDLWCEMFQERVEVDAKMLKAIIWKVHFDSSDHENIGHFHD